MAGTRTKGKKLQKFIDNGGIILKLKLKGEPNSKFWDIDQNKEYSVHDHCFNKWYNGHYYAPVFDFYFKDSEEHGYIRLSVIRYMLVKYPNGEIGTIWV